MGARSEPAENHFYQMLLKKSCFKQPHIFFNQIGAFPKIWSMKDADMKVALLGFWGVTQIDYLVSALQRCLSHNIFTVQNLEWQDPPKLRVRHILSWPCVHPCVPLWGVYPFCEARVTHDGGFIDVLMRPPLFSKGASLESHIGHCGRTMENSTKWQATKCICHH